MNRRTLIKSAAATASTFMISKHRSAAGSPTPTGSRGVWAAYFNGATMLQKDSPVRNCPASSPYGMVSYWYSYPGSWTSTNQTILGQRVPNGPQNLEIYHLITGSTKRPSIPNIALYALFSTGAAPGNTGYVLAFTPLGTFLPATGENLVQISWDLTVPIVKATVGGRQIPLGIDKMAPFTSGIQYNSWGGVPMQWVGGGGIFQGGGFYKGSLAEFYAYFLSEPPPDITDPTVQSRFIDAATGTPPPFEHRTMDGSNAIEESVSQIYWSGPGGIFAFSGKRMTNSGSRSILDISDPDFFYVAAGQLSTPTKDPWGRVGV